MRAGPRGERRRDGAVYRKVGTGEGKVSSSNGQHSRGEREGIMMMMMRRKKRRKR